MLLKARFQKAIKTFLASPAVPTKSATTSSVPVPATKTPELPKLKKWECSECWVRNEPTADKCVACGNKNPKAAVSDKQLGNSTESKPSFSFGLKSAPNPDAAASTTQASIEPISTKTPLISFGIGTAAKTTSVPATGFSTSTSSNTTSALTGKLER